jgi:hypothetical protein
MIRIGEQQHTGSTLRQYLTATSDVASSSAVRQVATPRQRRSTSAERASARTPAAVCVATSG